MATARVKFRKRKEKEKKDNSVVVVVRPDGNGRTSHLLDPPGLDTRTRAHYTYCKLQNSW